MTHQLVEVGVDYSQTIKPFIGGSERAELERVLAPVILHAALVPLGHLLVLLRGRVDGNRGTRCGDEGPRNRLDLSRGRNRCREIHAFTDHTAQLFRHLKFTRTET